MEKSEAVSADPVAGGAFSQLLFSVEEEAGYNRNRDGVDGAFNFSATAFYSADEKPPKMLCFGDYDDKIKNVCDLVFVNETIPNCGGVITCSTTTDSSSPPSSANNNSSSTNSVPMSSNRKRNGCNGSQPVGQSLTSRSQRNCKKARSSENSTTGGHAKAKKERLGERIAALQQLVSPFGKTDTASVLHEAMGYIKFLQAQVQVLCSPYLQRPPSNSSTALPLLHGCEENGEVELELKGKNLRSRGLCLVPVECTLQVAESNGADFWSPASTVNNAASSDHH